MLSARSMLVYAVQQGLILRILMTLIVLSSIRFLITWQLAILARQPKTIE